MKNFHQNFKNDILVYFFRMIFLCEYFWFKRGSCPLLHSKSVSYKEWLIPRTLTINTLVAFACQRRQLHKIRSKSQNILRVFILLWSSFFHGRIPCSRFLSITADTNRCQKSHTSRRRILQVGKCWHGDRASLCSAWLQPQVNNGAQLHRRLFRSQVRIHAKPLQEEE